MGKLTGIVFGITVLAIITMLFLKPLPLMIEKKVSFDPEKINSYSIKGIDEILKSNNKLTSYDLKALYLQRVLGEDKDKKLIEETRKECKKITEYSNKILDMLIASQKEASKEKEINEKKENWIIVISIIFAVIFLILKLIKISSKSKEITWEKIILFCEFLFIALNIFIVRFI